jgi:hypothetical protein
MQAGNSVDPEDKEGGVGAVHTTASGLTPRETHELRVLNLLDELYGKLHAIGYNPRMDPSGRRYGTISKMIEYYEHELVTGNERKTDGRAETPADVARESSSSRSDHRPRVSPSGRRHALAGS